MASPAARPARDVPRFARPRDRLIEVDPATNASAWIVRFTTVCLMTYIVIYCFESPIRYALNLVHADALILARDALIDIPAAMLAVSQMLRHKVHMAFLILFASLVVNGLIFFLNFGVIIPVFFGVKLLMNTVLGLVIGSILIVPSTRVLRLIIIMFIVTLIGIIMEKFLVTFPWVGLHTVIGGVDVEVSRDWQIQDTFSKRVGGFTRESIGAAGLIPVLSLIVASRARSLMLRFVILAMAIFCVFLTTQKGSIVALVLVMGCMIMPLGLRLAGLRILAITGLVMQCVVPFATQGMVMAMNSGGSAFSGASFADRVMVTWPSSWRWISDHAAFPFGVGMGGMGAPLRSVAPGVWQFPDNMFLFVIAYYGVFALGLYAVMVYAVWRSLRLSPAFAEPALAILTFMMFYGIVISGIEDQIMSLGLGAAVGTLLNTSVIERTVVSAKDFMSRSPLVRAAQANSATRPL